MAISAALMTPKGSPLMEDVTPQIPRQALVVALLTTVIESHGSLLWPNRFDFGMQPENRGWVFVDVADVPQLSQWARGLGWHVDTSRMSTGRDTYTTGGYLGGWRLVFRTFGPALDDTQPIPLVIAS